MNRQVLIVEMQKKLSSSGIAFETLKVFGAIRCNVHVTCVSRETANNWAQFLGSIFNGAKVVIVPTIWDAVKNNGGNLNPTKRKGFLISVAS